MPVQEFTLPRIHSQTNALKGFDPLRLEPRPCIALIDRGTQTKMLCLLKGIDHGHVDVVELIFGWQASVKSHLGVKRTSQDAAQERRRIDQFVEVHACVDA